jgi:predicted thioesterase
MDLYIGLHGEEKMTVTRRHLSSATGNIGAEVLSTHWVVLLMELAARNAIEARLPPGSITVGTRMDIRHLAAAPVGSRVRATARLENIKGRRLFFEVMAFDSFEKIAHGENEQLVVSQVRFLARVARKLKRINHEHGGPKPGEPMRP